MWPNPHETTDLVTFTEEILNGNLHFLGSSYAWAYTKFVFYIMYGSKLTYQRKSTVILRNKFLHVIQIIFGFHYLVLAYLFT